MEHIKLIAGIISAIVAVICFIPYIRDIWKKTTTPHTYTWLIWTLLQITGVLAMWSDGAGLGVLSLAIGAFFCAYIFLLSLKHGTKNITKFDTACLIGALIAFCIYVFLHNPLLSVILVALIDFVGFLPTVRKSFAEPFSETASTYVLSAISSVFAIIAIGHYSFITLAYISSLVITNSLCAGIILIRRKAIS